MLCTFHETSSCKGQGTYLECLLHRRKNTNSDALLPARGTGLHGAHHVLKLVERGDSFWDKRLELEREPFSKDRKYSQI